MVAPIRPDMPAVLPAAPPAAAPIPAEETGSSVGAWISGFGYAIKELAKAAAGSHVVQNYVYAPALRWYWVEPDYEKLSKLCSGPYLGADIFTLMRDMGTICAPFLSEGMSETVLTHLLANVADKVAADELRDGVTISPNEFMSRVSVYLREKLKNSFSAAEARARVEERGVTIQDFKESTDALIHSLLSDSKDETIFLNWWQPKGLEEYTFQLYLITKNIPTTDENALKQKLRVALWNPADYQAQFPDRVLPAAIDRSLAEVVGLENNIEQMVDLADKMATFILNKLNDQAADPENIRVLLKDTFPGQAATVAPLIQFLLTSDRAMIVEGKELLRGHIKRLLLKGMANAIETVQRDAGARIPNTALLTHLFNKVVPILGRIADPAVRVQGCQELVRVFFPNPLAEFPQTALVQEKGPAFWNKIEAEILPRMAGEWFQALTPLVDKIPQNKEALNTAFKANNVSKFCEVIGNVWVRDFIPHILNSKKETITASTFATLNEKYGTGFHPEVTKGTYTWLEASIGHLASNSAEGTALNTASQWGGKYAEALMLEVFRHIFVPIREVEDTLLANNAGNVGGSILVSVLPEITKFYDRLEEIKNNLAGAPRDAIQIPHDQLVAGLRRNDLLHPAFPTDGAAHVKVQDAHRLEAFKTWAETILNMGHVNTASVPFPTPLKETGFDFIKDTVLAQTLLTVMEKVRDPKNIDKMLLKGLTALKAYRLPERGAAVAPARPRAAPGAPRGFGELLENLVRIVPDPGYRYLKITELERVRALIRSDMNDAQIAELFDNICTEANFFKLINDQIENLLPEMVQNGVVTNRGSAIIDFVPARGGEALKATFMDQPNTERTSEEHAAFVNLGAEAIASGIENVIIYPKVRDFATWLENKVSGFFKKHESRHSKPIVALLGALYKFFVYKILVPLMIAICSLPRELLKVLYLRHVVERYREMALAPYHENAILNVVEKVISELNEAAQVEPVAG